MVYIAKNAEQTNENNEQQQEENLGEQREHSNRYTQKQYKDKKYQEKYYQKEEQKGEYKQKKEKKQYSNTDYQQKYQKKPQYTKKDETKIYDQENEEEKNYDYQKNKNSYQTKKKNQYKKKYQEYNYESQQQQSKNNNSLENSQNVQKFERIYENDLSQTLYEKFMSNTMECMICMNPINYQARIWNCSQCFQPFHLGCMRKWIQNSQVNKEKNQVIFSWNCPKCNFGYNEEIPEYICFCGQTLEPNYDPYIIPHSCGNSCNKRRGINCPHTCPLQCHPGPCPPCEQFGAIIKCYCGKELKQIKCSENIESYCCQQTCNKLLNCKNHRCQEICHEGECQPCNIQKLSRCYCGKALEMRVCGQDIYSCKQKCSKLLACSNHYCDKICHTGLCGECKYLPKYVKTCWCGKTDIVTLCGENSRKSCLDLIPVCGLPCKKLLSCGLHYCNKSCHEGECDKCRVLVKKKCRCGRAKMTVECWTINDINSNEQKEVYCDKVCNKYLSCGKHKCQNVCCNYKKDPSLHLCLKVCNKLLNCGIHRCVDFCHIGNCKKCSVRYNHPLTCPCGHAKLMPPVICGTPLPKCDQPCPKILPCGHKCKWTCHEGECPPCEERVTKQCTCGKKMIENAICSKEVSCQTKCGKLLPCGHTCQVECHAGECPYNYEENNCYQKCGKMKECGHTCSEMCHYGKECLKVECKVEVLVKCKCGRKEGYFPCYLAQSNIIECDDQCKTKQRFDYFFEDKKKKNTKFEYYSPELVHFAKYNIEFIEKMEDRMKSLLKSQTNTFDIQFQQSDINKKQKITELFSKNYNFEVEQLTFKKTIYIKVKKTEFSKIPSPILSNYVRLIEKGQIEPSCLPFEGSIQFNHIDKLDSNDQLEKILLNYKGEYYIERTSGRQCLVHFWNYELSKRAFETLRNSYTNFAQCSLLENTTLTTPSQDNQQVALINKLNQEEFPELISSKPKPKPKQQQHVQKKIDIQNQ